MSRFHGYLLNGRNHRDLLGPLRRASHMADTDRMPLLDLDDDAALRTILEGTATETGERFFYALVENLAKGLGTDGAMVTRYWPEKRQLEAYAFWMDGTWVKEFIFNIDGTPCEQ